MKKQKLISILVSTCFIIGLVAAIGCDDSEKNDDSQFSYYYCGKKKRRSSLASSCSLSTYCKAQELQLTNTQLTAYSLDDAPHMKYNSNLSHIYTPDNIANDMDGHYRADIDLTGLENHPGCNRTNVYYDTSNSAYDGREPYYDFWQRFGLKDSAPGELWTPKNTSFPCAAKKYQNMTLSTYNADIEEVAEDTTKDIILLFHGNATSVHMWEKYDIDPELTALDIICNLPTFPCADIVDSGSTPDEDGNERDMLAERLAAAGHVVIAADARHDRISSGADGNTPGISANSGYYVPLNTIDDAAFDNNEGVALGEGTGLQIHYDLNQDSQYKALHNKNHEFDHGWAVPIYQATIKAVMEEYATSLTYTDAHTRKIVIIGHGMGVTAARDAIRRLFHNYLNDPENNYNPFAVITKFIGLSGMNHGTATYDGTGPASQYGMRYCTLIENMKGKISCELGSRLYFTDTHFTSVLNGPGRLFETPCADGLFAYGRGLQTGVAPNGVLTCGDSKLAIVQNSIEYWTITMEDYEDGTYKQRYTYEDSAKLGALGDMEYACSNNKTITTNDFDTSRYKTAIHHYGSARGEAGMNMVERIINGSETKTSGR